MNFEFIIIPVVIVFILILFFPLFLDIFKKQSSTLSGIRNYNSTMTEFCYKVPRNKQEIINILSTPNIYDELEYTFDQNSFIITFNSIEHGSPTKYKLMIQENGSESSLKVQAVHKIAFTSRYSVLQNSFWSKKIQAEPVQYF